MKIKILSLAVCLLVLSSCVSPLAPADTAPQTVVSPETADESMISVGTVADLAPAITLQPSAGALVCSWAQGGELIWVQDMFSVGLYDSATMDLLAQFDGGEYAAIYDASSDGKTVAYSLDGQEINLFDMMSQKDRLSFSPDFPWSAAFFSPDGATLGVASLENIEIVLFGVEDGLIQGSLSGFTTAAPVYTARFSPNGEMLIWESRATVQPMNIDSGELGKSLDHEDFVVAAVMSPDGSMIATAAAGTLEGEFQPMVTLWDAKSGDMIWQNGNPGYLSSLDFSPDGSLLAAGTEGAVIIYLTESGEELVRLNTGTESVNNLAFSPDSSSLLTCETDGKLTIWQP